MEIKEEELTYGEFKDLPDFKKRKVECYEKASKDMEFDISDLRPPEYKYFTELYVLYNKLVHKEITKEEAEKADNANYKNYCDDKTLETTYTMNIASHNSNIRKASMYLSKLTTTNNKDVAFDCALDIIERLLNESSIKSTVKEHIYANSNENGKI